MAEQRTTKPDPDTATVGALTAAALAEVVKHQGENMAAIRDSLATLRIENRTPESSPVVAAVSVTRVQCQLCQREGHDALGCRLTQRGPDGRSDALGATRVQCQLCGRQGHGALRCRVTQRGPAGWSDAHGRSSAGFRRRCWNCGRYGHISRECRAPHNVTNGKKTVMSVKGGDFDRHYCFFSVSDVVGSPTFA